MHKPPLMILQSHDNSRHLRELGEDFKKHKINIRGIGGGENNGVGVFAFAFDHDDAATVGKVKDIAKDRNVNLVEWDGLTVELPDQPGALGEMAGVLDDADINIGSLLVVGSHADSAIVLVGVPAGTEKVAHDALVKAGFYVFDDTHAHATATV